jgi:hypothetical protein
MAASVNFWRTSELLEIHLHKIIKKKVASMNYKSSKSLGILH